MLGVALFDRSGRQLKPTAAGEVIVRHVRETLRGLTFAQAQIEELKGLRSGLIRIGLMSGLAANFLRGRFRSSRRNIRASKSGSAC